MADTAGDELFAGSIPKFYETYLVPLIFGPYAADIVSRLSPRPPRRLLEVAAGTGVVTRAMASGLPARTSIVATDLNQAMLDHAATLGTQRPVEFKQADAMQLPFPDGSFDAVVCQFGVMFFPDRPKALSEFHRVLRPGGVVVFNVWDRLSENEFAHVIEEGLATMLPASPPRFLSRTPYGYFDHARIAQDIRAGGFTAAPKIDTVTARSRAANPKDPAIAYCQGTPLRAEIEARGSLDAATNVAAEAIAEKFGRGAVDAKTQAHVVTVEKSGPR